ncbi:polysaccharide pyruvyl transferase family protein [Caballeronia insecticola]|uniref:Polysaccharide pyruvyl transferase domain-containing protein n=1 Tax=Caballeronia insecticola TaxID=758793 RepID=R4WZN1_9BURK|nr:polysaccharide pyruvyl transferase family protein [Caballeronia insecticola]BAN23942.1 hypothetical protein BRPE64_ACDS21880 [Caballeronia insecticola]
MTNTSVASFATQTHRVLADDPLIAFLKSIANQHVHVFPKSGNAGDGFISYAMYSLFQEFNISFTAHNQEDTVEGETVVIGGGGNLIEGHYNDVADLIRRHEEKNRVVLLPHTIVGFADVLAKTHGNLTVFCREKVSHQLALLNGANPAQTHLSHDLVFFLENDHFEKYFQAGKGVLRALRTDGEASGNMAIPADSIDISLSWNGDIWTSPQFCAHVTQAMAAFISPYATVQTDRLHVSVLSAFLQKDVYMMPNSYYKNRAVFEHSIHSRFPKVVFVNTMPTVDNAPTPLNQLPEAATPAVTSAIETAGSEDPKLNELIAELRVQLANTLGMLNERAAQAESAIEEVTMLKSRIAHAEETAMRAVESREKVERSFELQQQALRERFTDLARESERLRADLAREQERTREQLVQDASSLSQKSASLDAEMGHLRREAIEQRQRAETLHHDLNAVLTSTSWRLSRPLRSIIVRSRTLLRGSR